MVSALPVSSSSAAAKAIVMMVAAAGILTVNDAIAKWLTERYPVGQVLALRGILVVALVFGWAAASGRMPALRVLSWRLNLTRGGLMALSTFLFVTSLSLMPIADAIAISFAGPIFATALAALLLAEPVGWRRWSAVAVGFAGVVVMVRPTPEMFRMVALIPILAAFVGALRDIVTRKMGTGGESTLMVLIVSTSVVAFAGLLTLPFGWVVPTAVELGLFVLTSALVAVAQGLMIESLKYGEVGLVGPFKYTSLLWALVLGLLVWGDVPGPWTWAGAALVIASGLYIWYRETMVRRTS
ncbi:MAG: DMT family transporter [Thalassobaculaceae bacterium]